MSYQSVSSPNCAAVFVGPSRVTYRSRLAARMAFLAGGATNIGTGLGGLFGQLNPRGQMFPGPLRTLLCSGPEKAAVFPVAELTR